MKNQAVLDKNIQLEDFGKSDVDYDIEIFVGNLQPLHKSHGKMPRHIFGEASNESLDLEGDLVDASGVKESMDFWKSHGKLDWCHKGASLPDFLVGEPVDWMQHKGRLMIEGALYDDWPMADKVYGLLKGGARLGYSLGGKILKTRPVFDKSFGGMVKRVQKVFVNHVAVTPFPVNYNTTATLVPWSGFLGMLDKDITGKEVGAGSKEMKKTLDTVAGQALLTESLEHSGNKELVNALANIIGGMKGGTIRDTKFFSKSGRFKSPRHAYGYLTKVENLSPQEADILTDYLVLRHSDIASIL